MRLIFSLALLILTLSLRADESAEITVPELYQHISYLASDSLQGRKPGTREGRLAAEYIRNHALTSRLTLLGNDGFQYLEVVTTITPGENNNLSYPGIETAPEDFTPLNFTGNETLSAQMVFAGYGFDFDTDSLSWHDYENIDVEDKWVLILRGDPEIDKLESAFEPYSSMRKKGLVAKDQGAKGVLFVSGEEMDEKDELVKLFFDKSPHSMEIPILHVKRHVIDKLLAPYQQSVAGLEKELNSSQLPHSFAVEEIVTATAHVIRNKGKTQNIVALLPGADPMLKDEYIVLGAHYDHLGLGGIGSGSRRPDTLAVHNGADDNASGVAAALEIMEKLAANRDKVKRSILFTSFAAEEMGTLGSKHFIENPPVDKEDIKFMFNLDMIGRMDPETNLLTIGGTGTATGLEELVQECTAPYNLTTKFSPEGYGPSDHAPFYANDIPVLFFIARVHKDYHTPDDDTDKINFPGEKIIADYIYDLIVEIANRPESLTFQEAGPKTQPSMRRRFKVTLGIVPDFASSDVKGVRAEVVIPGRPAARSGMEKGDIITAIEGKPVNDIYEYMHRLSEFNSGQRVSVEVNRNSDRVILIVEL